MGIRLANNPIIQAHMVHAMVPVQNLHADHVGTHENDVVYVRDRIHQDTGCINGIIKVIRGKHHVEGLRILPHQPQRAEH